MKSELRDPTRQSKIVLLVLSILTLVFVSGWPAMQIFLGRASGEAGLGLIIVSPLLWVIGFIATPILFWIARSFLRLPQLTFSRVWVTSFIFSVIGAAAFMVPVMLPSLLFNNRVNNFKIEPALVSQSLDQLNKTYKFTLQLDNKTNRTYENVKVYMATGFLHRFPSESFVWTANHAPSHTLDLKPGVTTITDSINLSGCSENSDFQHDPVRLSVELTFGSDGLSNRDGYTKKKLMLTPEVSGIDFATYYSGICDWFSHN